jgi:hypothetical protein
MMNPRQNPAGDWKEAWNTYGWKIEVLEAIWGWNGLALRHRLIRHGMDMVLHGTGRFCLSTAWNDRAMFSAWICNEMNGMDRWIVEGRSLHDDNELWLFLAGTI